MRNFFRSVKKIKSRIELLGGNFELFVILFVILPKLVRAECVRCPWLLA